MCVHVHVHVHVLRSPCGASRAPLMLRRTCRRFAFLADASQPLPAFAPGALVVCYFC